MIENLLSVLPEFNVDNLITGAGGVSAAGLVVYLWMKWREYKDNQLQATINKANKENEEKLQAAAKSEGKAETLEATAGKELAKADEANKWADELLVKAAKHAAEIEASKRAERELLAKREAISSTIEGLTPEQVNDEFHKRGY